MYSSAASIRREVRKALGKEIHEPTGLPVSKVLEFARGNFRYCVYWKTKSGRTYIATVSPNGTLLDYKAMALKKRQIDDVFRARPGSPPETYIGMCQVRLMTPAQCLAYGKFEKWIDAQGRKI